MALCTTLTPIVKAFNKLYSLRKCHGHITTSLTTGLHYCMFVGFIFYHWIPAPLPFPRMLVPWNLTVFVRGITHHLSFSAWYYLVTPSEVILVTVGCFQAAISFRLVWRPFYSYRNLSCFYFITRSISVAIIHTVT